ncbi:MAG: 2-C-methyl-D-erythritol 4-phosphate cytidylyltransferase [Proteobacteria bacterium]|nr:2-C-methyl-D-erythritol 4-phosphate cytidylyltransferase [Pseudomonadota bacterium]MBU1649704.1 2-C-methyl-D-erythritol 4-phosphate cytidylyltransferase [Pseudomonadota bacterium]MBU1986584.1 2-C-methyl-D-erythritol 4-phosphate cytidylyltransferase [Pseudomonadota bacterium]
MPSVAAIIPAAGSGTRMGLGHPKQYHCLAGTPILIHTIRAFVSVTSVSRIIVVVPKDFIAETRQLLTEYKLTADTITVTAGGRRRQDSVLAGMECLTDATEVVLVHDGARPLVRPELIQRCLEAAWQHGAAIAAIPVKDTLKRAHPDGTIACTVDRHELWQAQTPQAVKFSLLKEAYARLDDKDVTDEAALLEQAGMAVTLIEGSETNIKITRPDDLILAEKIMHTPSSPSMRIGHGYDAHRLVTDRDLVLAGITVPHKLGLAGHSDADVVTHALCDAVLGALGAGDIGRHFPDSDQQFKDIFSITLLEQVMELAFQKGFTVSNADITVICQAPKLAPHIEGMRTTLAQACQVSSEQINLKATTTEKMGFTGREEGISCHAVVLLTTRQER